jgi:hypothetical protein
VPNCQGTVSKKSGIKGRAGGQIKGSTLYNLQSMALVVDGWHGSTDSCGVFGRGCVWVGNAVGNWRANTGIEAGPE